MGCMWLWHLLAGTYHCPSWGTWAPIGPAGYGWMMRRCPFQTNTQYFVSSDSGKGEKGHCVISLFRVLFVSLTVLCVFELPAAR